MNTIQDIYAELRAAFGNRWTVLGVLVAGLVARADWLGQIVAHRNMEQLVGLPDWAVGLLILTTWSAGAAILHAVRLRKTVTPAFRLTFPKQGFGIVRAIQRIVAPGQAIGTVEIYDIASTYVRIQADTISRVVADGCFAFITRLEYRKFGETNFAEIAIPQPIMLRDQPFSIFPQIPCPIDFVKASQNKDGDRLSIALNEPFILSERIQDQGTYRFEITVHGPGGSLAQCVEVDWHGKWNTITANEVLCGYWQRAQHKAPEAAE